MGQVILTHVDPNNDSHLQVLYSLMDERTPEQSISHQRMPTFDYHRFFVQAAINHGEYLAWCLIDNVDAEGLFTTVGSIYVTAGRLEVGLWIFRRWQRRGFGREAFQKLRQVLPPIHGPLLANVNPANAASIAFWESLGFKHVQNTYRLGDE